MVKVGNMSMAQFESILKKKNVICFCAGRALQELCDEYDLLNNKIEYIVDNSKNGEICKIGGKKIPIIDVSVLDFDDDMIVIISSIKYADEIIKQLDDIRKFDGMTVYVPHMFTEEKESKTKNDSAIPIIPKTIHYCWFGNNPIPQKFKDNIKTWEKYCPDYEIILWNESNYDWKKNKYMKQAYEAKKWGFVPDYARLDIINSYGGIYLDTDVELVRNIDSLLQYKLFCGFESRKYVAFGLGFGSKKEHHILKEMMDEYDKTDFLNYDGTLNLLPSPAYQTNVLLKHGLVCDGRTQHHDDYSVFSQEYFAPINAIGFGNITKNTYSIHQYAATWYDEEQKKDKKKILESVNYIKQRLDENLSMD